MKKLLSLVLLFSLFLTVQTTKSLAQDEVSIEEALNIALKDEYNARNTYELVLDDYPESRVFKNIVKAEMTHAQLVQEVMDQYGYPYQEYVKDEDIVIGTTLEENLALAIKGEEENIDIYENFLSKDYPDDVKDLFTRLLNSSKSHLRAFTRNLEQPNAGWGMGMKFKGRYNFIDETNPIQNRQEPLRDPESCPCFDGNFQRMRRYR